MEYQIARGVRKLYRENFEDVKEGATSPSPVPVASAPVSASAGPSASASASSSPVSADASGEPILMDILSFVISAYAASLSWRCNASSGKVMRVIYALFAYMFGMTYLVLYLIFRRGECSKSLKTMGSVMGMKIKI